MRWKDEDDFPSEKEKVDQMKIENLRVPLLLEFQPPSHPILKTQRQKVVLLSSYYPATISRTYGESYRG